MNCPRCHAEPPRDPFVCTGCGERLLTYLDEPFGPGSGVRLEGRPVAEGAWGAGAANPFAPGAGPAVLVGPPGTVVPGQEMMPPWPGQPAQPGQPTQPGRPVDNSGLLVLKGLFGFCIGVLLIMAWSLMGIFYFGVVGLLLWRWRRARLIPFGAALIGIAFLFAMFGDALDAPDLADVTELFEPEPTATVRPIGTSTPDPAFATPTLLPAQRTATATAVTGEYRVHLSHARARWLRADNPAALAALERALSLTPNQAEALNLRAQVRISAGDFQGGAADVARALDIQPNAATYHDTRAYASLKLGRYQEARETYDTALRTLQGDARTASLLGRGLALTALGELGSARDDLQAGLRMLPDLSPDPQLADLETLARRALDPIASRPGSGSPAASPVASPVVAPAVTPTGGGQPGRTP